MTHLNHTTLSSSLCFKACMYKSFKLISDMSVLTMKLEYIKRDIGDYELRSPTCKHFSLFKIMNDTHFYLKTYPLTSAL